MLFSSSKGGTACPPFVLPSSIHAFHAFETLPSTNDYLVELASSMPPSHPHYQRNILCMAAQQTAGKGRRGRTWVSPINNIYLSLLWHFPLPSAQLAGLSLAVSCAVAHTIEALTGDLPSALALKWPNDVLWQQQKLSGILIELIPFPPSGASTPQTRAVIGIGLNLHPLTLEPDPCAQPYTDLSTILGYPPDKYQISTLLVHQLTEALSCFQTAGFRPFMPQWTTWDQTVGKSVQIITPTSTVEGIGRGIDPQGLFLLEKNSGEILKYSSGDVSLRLKPREQ